MRTIIKSVMAYSLYQRPQRDMLKQAYSGFGQHILGQSEQSQNRLNKFGILDLTLSLAVLGPSPPVSQKVFGLPTLRVTPFLVSELCNLPVQYRKPIVLQPVVLQQFFRAFV